MRYNNIVVVMQQVFQGNYLGQNRALTHTESENQGRWTLTLR